MITETTPDPRNILGHVPGRICAGATDLSLDYPHGGVDLGEIADCVCTLRSPRSIFRQETTGYQTVEIVSHGESMAMFMGLREHNAEAYSRFFLNAAAGSVSGFPVVSGFGTKRHGHLHIDDAQVFVFTPYDIDTHPMVVFYAGVPLTEETTQLRTMLGGDAQQWIVPAVIEATLDGSDRDWKVGRRDDLSL